jgi:glycosyltransferase involved in cell wall biosynthesis
VTPAVSVIVPTYNRADRIGTTIEALLGSGVPDLEVVIVDDGSRDATGDVVRAFGGPVHYVRQSNAGPARARNNGFEQSRGRYVLFIDDDDWWHPGSVARLARHLDAHPQLPCVFGDTSMGSTEDGFVSFVETYGADTFRALEGRQLAPDLILFDRWPFFRVLSRRNVMFLGSLLLRRETFRTIGGFDEALRGAADWEFFMRLAVAHDVAFDQGPPIAVYLKHATGMSTDSTHMEADFSKALANILAKCTLPGDVRAHVEFRLREQCFGMAYTAYDRGDTSTARTLLKQMVREGRYGVRELAYYGLSSIPAPAVKLLRSVKHRLSA